MATYFVRSAGGSDGNSGLSFALGWATIQYAADNASAAGDIVLICDDGTHLPTATVDFNTNAGAKNNPIVFRGASATGVDNGTIATISGASLPATTDLFNLNISALAIKFELLRITAATRVNILIGTAFNEGLAIFRDVRIDNAATDGILDSESATTKLTIFINCEIDSNGDKGLESVGVARGGHKMLNCSIHDNTGDGIEENIPLASPKSEYVGCLFYNNGGSGLNSITGGFPAVLIHNCIFFNNTNDGITFNSTITYNYGLVVTNNIFRSNGGYGINTNTGILGQFAYADYNCLSNNTSGAIDINAGVAPGSNNVTTDPTFTNETAGSEDFTLQSGSPCLDVGLGYNG